VLAQLQYLSQATHYAGVVKLVRDLLGRLGATPDSEIAIDPIKVALLVADEIDRRYKSLPARFDPVAIVAKLEVKPQPWHVPESFSDAPDKSSIASWK
jgi:hypothetical protein